MPLTDWDIRTLRKTFLVACFSLLAWGQSPKSEAPKAALPRLKIVLDPGHGGEDVGAKGAKGLFEKNAALAIAKAVGTKLEAAGFDVAYTRSDDAFVPLWDRAKIANAQGADLFISLHLNAAKARAAKGSEVYFLSLTKGDEDAEAIAELENGGAGPSSNPDSVIASILDDLAQKAFLQDSERLAVSVQLELNHLAGIRERGVKQAGFVVLRGAAMPAVLVESAFISNPKEEQKLRDEAFITKLAEAITNGVRKYFAKGGNGIRRKAMEVDPK
jgi:N-acetylmuramoyl-L-alanine amidase